MSAGPGHPNVNYRPGAWVAVAGADLWLLGDMDPGSAAVAGCWEIVGRRAGLDALLGAILREGLRAIPSFVAVGRVGDRLRLLLFGNATAEVVAPDGSHETISAAQIATWVDREVDASAMVRCMAAPNGDAGAAQLPLFEGVVLAHMLEIAASPAAAAPVAPAAPKAAATSPAAAEPEAAAAEPKTAAEPEPDVLPDTPAAPEAPASSPRRFDHLFGETQAPPPSPTEDADHQPAAGQDPPGEEPPPGEPNPEAKPAAVPVSVDTMQQPPEAEPAIIESLPWPLPGRSASPVAAGGPPPQLPVRPAFPDAPAHPAGAAADAPRPGAADAPRPAAADARLEHTVTRSSLGAGAQAADGGPTVTAVACPEGHLSEVHADRCRVCGSPIAPQSPFQARRPVLGTLSLSTGDLVMLDRDIVLGRAPAQPQEHAQRRPHIVRLPSPQNDISRTHLRVQLDGWHVLVTDLGSTNGTVVTLPGQDPLRLRPNDPFTIVPGTVVNLADEVSFRYEVPR